MRRVTFILIYIPTDFNYLLKNQRFAMKRILTAVFIFLRCTTVLHAQHNVPGNCIPVATLPTQSANYQLVWSPQSEGFTSSAQLAVSNLCDMRQSVQYYDGLNRPIQSILVQGSPEHKDIVIANDYDYLGREAMKMLPYAASQANGAYINNVINMQRAFYLAPPTGITANTFPYFEYQFEASPIGEKIKEYSPSEPWSSSNAISKRFLRHHNNSIMDGDPASRKLALYSAQTGTNGISTLNRTNGSEIYADYLLDVKVYKDEDCVDEMQDGSIEEYQDKMGRVVARRTFNRDRTTWVLDVLTTYFVYDQFNNLSFILPPGAEPDHLGGVSQDILDKYCYQYRYDSENRVVEKKVPGKGWEFFVYNSAGQLIMVQDANQRNKTPQEWSFAKYDALGRPILSGIYVYPGSSAQPSSLLPDNSYRLVLQGMLSGQSTLWETRDSGGPNGYTNLSLPTADITAILAVNYYDDYNIPGLPAIYNKANEHSKMVNGLLTASKKAVLGNLSAMLWTVLFYDDRGRTVRTFEQHYLGGSAVEGNFEETNSTYKFNGELTSINTVHNAGGTVSLSLSKRFQYDHNGRRINSWQSINGSAEILISQNKYNEIDQLVSRKVHSEDGGASFLHSTELSYNGRGWPLSQTSPLFTLELSYDNANEATPQYNGNISSVRWGSTYPDFQFYNYEYDDLNRLTKGESPQLSENGITYDKNGNITSMSRDGDPITYQYDGNRLTSVSGVGLYSANYVYDDNGNTKVDGSKNNVHIDYNKLNQPSAITGSQNISYTYDAEGTMLSKLSSTTGFTEYAGGVQYGDVSGSHNIDFVLVEGGRAVRQSDGSYKFQYDLTDHLGNVRVTFDKSPINGSARVIQKDDYYAFGKRASIQGGSNRYLYNGKELQDELGELDYGARFYNPEIARWNTPDPHAESYASSSPYAYVVNNPISLTDPTGMDIHPWIKPIFGSAKDMVWIPDYYDIPLGWMEVQINAGFLSDVEVSGTKPLWAKLQQGRKLPTEASDPGTITAYRPKFNFGKAWRHYNEEMFVTSPQSAMAGRLLEDFSNEIYIFSSMLANTPENVRNMYGEDLLATYGAQGSLDRRFASTTTVLSLPLLTLGAAASGEKRVFTVTTDGVVLPKGAKIPNSFVENANRPGNYGVLENGKYIEKVRIDPGTPANKKGPGVSHFHLDNGKEHITDLSRWPWWQK